MVHPVLVPFTVILLRRRSNTDSEEEALCITVRILQRRRLQRRFIQRGLYCIPVFNRHVAAILNLEPVPLIRNCRLTPGSFRSLMALVTQHTPPRNYGYSIEFSVIVTIYWLAVGMSFRTCGNTFDLCRSTVFDLTNVVLDAIVGLARHVVKFPEEDMLPIIGENFDNMADSPVFSNCVGAMDGCQVRFICDDVNRHDDYINHKLYYSINLQGLVDHQARFIDVCVGFPGSCHDLRLLRHSGVYREGLYPPRGYFLIADGGYICMRDPVTMIVPYRDVRLTEDQLSFNYHLSRARSVVERAFGLLQARWRVLFHRAVEVKFLKAVKLISACVILHNICIDAGDFIACQRPQRRNQPAPRGERSGEDLRDVMCLAHNLGRRQAAQERHQQEE